MCLKFAIENFSNFEFEDYEHYNGKFLIKCNMNLYTGVECNKDVSIELLYDSEEQKVSGETETLIQILDKEKFMNYYRKNRIHLYAIVTPAEEINKNGRFTKSFTSDLDIYMMAMNGLKSQESYYHLLLNGNIVGQLKANFEFISQNLSNQERSFIRHDESSSMQSDEASQGKFSIIISYLELRSAIKRSLDTNIKVSKGINYW